MCLYWHKGSGQFCKQFTISICEVSCKMSTRIAFMQQYAKYTTILRVPLKKTRSNFKVGSGALTFPGDRNTTSGSGRPEHVAESWHGRSNLICASRGN